MFTNLSLSQSSLDNLINERSPVLVLLPQHLCPQLHVTSLHQVACLRLEQAVLITHSDQLSVAVATLVSLGGEVGVALLAVLADNLHRGRTVMRLRGKFSSVLTLLS